MTGSTLYSFDSGSYFADSYKKLLKTQAGKNKSIIEELIEEIVKAPFGYDCKEEPRPNKMKLPENWRFFKLRRKIAPHPSRRRRPPKRRRRPALGGNGGQAGASAVEVSGKPHRSRRARRPARPGSAAYI